MGKVKNDHIDLKQFYNDIQGLTSDQIRQHCQDVIKNSVGTPINKLRFTKMLDESTSNYRMIKLITDYTLAGQGMAVGSKR